MDEKWGYIDTDGNEIFPCQLSIARSFYENRAFVSDAYLNHGYIDLDGNVIFASWGLFGWDFSNGLAGVWIYDREGDSMWGYINIAGEMVIPCAFESALPFKDGRADVKIDGEWYTIDTEGNIIDSRFYPYSCGLARMKDENHYGYVNEAHEAVIPCEYDIASDFKDGYALVGLRIKSSDYYFYGMIDTQGNMVLDCIYRSINYGDGYYTASTDSKWIIFDEDFNIVLKQSFL